MKPALVLLTLCYLLNTCKAWDQSELEIFDLVEEINANFYEVLGINQNCSQGEIRKAYRKLSLVLHPDKNDAPDAEEKFRQLVGIYEVLKDETKRSRYDQILVEGLPNWRQPLYYYRRVRKMGMLELSVWLFVLFTIGQYAVAWAAYFEKKLTLDEVKAAMLKKQQKQMKKKKVTADEVDDKVEQLFAIPKPSYKNTLPFQLVAAIIAIPATVRKLMEYREQLRKEREERIAQEKKEAEELERIREEMEREKELKKTRKRRTIPLPSYDGEPVDNNSTSRDEDGNPQVETKPANKIISGFWSDDDLAELASLMKKYPAGTMERWEKIADSLNRTVAEVTHFAKKIKDNAFRPPEEIENEGMAKDQLEKKKEKTRGGKNILLAEPTKAENGTEEPPGSTGWTQKQQKSLETALATFTKGCSDRWERIAKAVPGKTKEECMLRVKYLSDLVKKKKQMEEEVKSGEEQGNNDSDEAQTSDNRQESKETEAEIETT